MFNAYAVRLSAPIIPAIVAWAAERQWNLDHLEDSHKYNADMGFATMLFLTMTDDDQTIVTFNDVPYDDSKPSIRMTEDTIFGFFNKFEKI
jgi:hypothetical protein